MLGYSEVDIVAAFIANKHNPFASFELLEQKIKAVIPHALPLAATSAMLAVPSQSPKPQPNLAAEIVELERQLQHAKMQHDQEIKQLRNQLDALQANIECKICMEHQVRKS